LCGLRCHISHLGKPLSLFRFSPGLTKPTGYCNPGYYCGRGARAATPDSFITQTYGTYKGETCTNQSRAGTNDVCPVGFFCPRGSGAPQGCPAGTYSNSRLLSNSSQCRACPQSYFCPRTAIVTPFSLCTVGYYCPGGDATPTKVCPRGYRCPTGSPSPDPCPAGQYQNATGQGACLACPPGYYCSGGTVTPFTCPIGYFCPRGTNSTTTFPCPIGTFSNQTGLRAQSQCTACLGGTYCATTGIDLRR
jgi:hypothetical protein